MTRKDDRIVEEQTPVATQPTPEGRPARLQPVRTALAGVLMGLANLVPGVSGGTMVLVMGLYDRFVETMADLTRLKFSRRHILFALILVSCAAVAIGLGAGAMGHLVTTYRSAMYALFIGMTLGGAPLLWRMVRPLRTPSAIGVVVGLGVMVLIAANRQEKPPEPPGEVAEHAIVAIEPSYGRDVAAGVLGMSAMVLPGISGAYMLLVLGRYEAILEAVSQAVHFAASLGREGELSNFLPILVPVAMGSLVSLIGLSNLLKWLLQRYHNVTVGFLLGVLLGSVVGIWPFDSNSTLVDAAVGVMLALVGCITTSSLSRIQA